MLNQVVYRQYSREAPLRIEVSKVSASPDPTWTVDDLPLLGEAFAVELANTCYRSDREDLDFLADADAVAMWFEHASAAAGIAVPGRVPPDGVAAIRRVRDATRLILAQAADDASPPSGAPAAETLNREARRAVAHLALDVGGDGVPTWQLRHEGRDVDVFVAATAGRCILFLGGPDIARVRRCEHPHCPMFFVQRHRARRFCHESCAHSIRQARYYRSALRQRRAGPNPGSPD